MKDSAGKKSLIRIWISVAVCVCLLAGCSQKKKEEAKQPQEYVSSQGGYTGMEGSAPRFDYETPRMLPRILTDQVGYSRDSVKTVFFIGGEKGQSFEVIDEKTGKSVYSGRMEYAGRDDELDMQVCRGNFTEIAAEGTYYVRADEFGSSYSFAVAEGLYEDILTQMCRRSEKLWDSSKAYDPQELPEDARTISNLLIAYEYYKGLFTDDTGCGFSKNSIPDILDIISVRVKKIAALDRSALSYEQLASYTGILAKFSADYKIMNAKEASSYLAAAKEGYAALSAKGGAQNDDSYLFYAAAELQRATGEAVYHSAVRRYLESPEEKTGSMDLYGKIAYMSSKYYTDMSLCEGIISALLREVEKITAAYSKNVYLAMGECSEKDYDDIVKLVLVNYAITNHEYVTVQGNLLHYFWGRNPQSVNEYSVENMRQTSVTVLLLCELVKSEMEGKN